MIEWLQKRFDFWTIAGMFVFVVIVFIAISQIITGTKDGTFEQVAEDIIKHQTGIDIDFTPEN